MRKKQLEQKLKKDTFIKGLIDEDVSFELTGGAIVDIIEDRKPKDYDFLSINEDKLVEDMGFKFSHKTEYAETYTRDEIVVQKLLKDINSFDFTISQARLEKSSRYSKEYYLTIDEKSFENKKLIPVSFEQSNALNALSRIPHWKKKGYDIHEHTYLSLLYAAFDKPVIRGSS